MSRHSRLNPRLELYEVADSNMCAQRDLFAKGQAYSHVRVAVSTQGIALRAKRSFAEREQLHMKCSRTIVAVVCSTFLACRGPSVPASHDPVPQATAIQSEDPWVLVDSVNDRLTVFLVGEPPLIFDNIAVGAAGVKEKRRAGDDVTPRGTYTVGWLQPHSKFVHFIGLTYPSRADAERGYREGTIDRLVYERIVSALDRGELPPQDTKLGGLIGIHGLGRGPLTIHRIANWTAGCIAVDNHQIRSLFKLLKRGMKVEIR